MRKNDPRSLSLPLAVVLLGLLAVPAASQGSIPTETCSSPKVIRPAGCDASAPVHDAGSGKTVVTNYGSAEREILMPVFEDGMMGLAPLYHRWLKVDASYTAWDGSGTSLEGGSIPTPNMDSANLATDPADGAFKVQPRPGTMPGLYLYYDNTEGSYYHYGGPLESGASPQSTAIYELAEGGGGGGMFVPAFIGPLATTIYTNNLSGAQLWYYGSATVPFIEIKHVDGTVARCDSFDPYKAGYSASGVLWRVTSVRDPYDNTAIYTYSSNHRLTQITFPSGLKQIFDYSPSWASNFASGIDCLEIRYEQGSTSLPARTWGLVFSGTLGTSSGRHFGKRLYRAYSATRRVLHDPPSGAPYTWSSDPYVEGQIVHELFYDTTNRILLETQSIHTGTAFAATLSGPSGLPTVEILETRYVTSGGNAGRVVSQEVPLTGETFECTYPSATRTLDLLSQSVGNLRAIAVEAADGTVRQFEYDYEHGYVYRVVTTPTTTFDGSPRASHAGSENSGIGGVADSDVEPINVTIDYRFDGACACLKPIEMKVQPLVAGGAQNQPSPRITSYTYYVGTKLLQKRTEPNPQTGSGAPSHVEWQFTYKQAKTATLGSWGAWLPETETTPDGIIRYDYWMLQDRTNADGHGRMPGLIQRSVEKVRRQLTLTGAPTDPAASVDVSESRFLNLSSNPSGLGWSGGVIQGQPRLMVDPDGVAVDYEYTSQGWVSRVTAMSGQSRVDYTHDIYGQVQAATQNAGSTGHAVTTTFTHMSGVGVPSEWVTGSGSAPLAKSGQFFDRFGHRGIERRWNRDSAGNKPANHAGTTTSARDWVEEQYHYLHRRLIATYRDRLPLDQPAGTGQFLKTEMFYDSLARLDYVINPNGSRTFYDFDGYGTLYRSYTKDPTLSTTVAGPKQFVNPFLEVTGSYEYAGIGADGATHDHLWTVILRNGAGAVIQVSEPKTVAPANYATPSGGGGGVFSTGGARHDFSLDALGRVVRAETYEVVGSATLLLASREMRYDQLGRQIWQHDDARLRDINATSASSTGGRHVAWTYKAGGERQLVSIESTGTAAASYEYHSSGLLQRVRDGFSTGNTVDYAYHSGTPFLSLITRTDLDSAGGTRQTTTAYDADPLGRTTAIKEGSPQLVHSYAYNRLGGVDRYTDPMSRVQKFLPDAMGRIVEHVRVGAGSDYIRNTSVFEDSGSSDGRTRVVRTDHLGHTAIGGHMTITHYDFAGRPFIVQNPGGDTVPTSSAKHQIMSLYAEYDPASRLQYVYDGEQGKTRFYRDGMGRVIQRELASAVYTGNPATDSKIAIWNTRDVFRRDAIGRIAQTDYWGGLPGIHGSLWAVGITNQDSIGRTHKERFHFAPAPVNALEIVSAFSGGNPYRGALDYEDGLDTLGGGYAAYSQPLDLDFTHDAVGRLDTIEWNRAGTSTSMNVLAEYGWVGQLRRQRTVRYQDAAYPRGVSTFAYDSYGRLTQGTDVVVKEVLAGSPPTPTLVSAVASQFDYEYDAAGNLIKEKYLKVGTVGGNPPVGDRFAYDAYHRLTTAWMGVNSATMAATSNPTGFSASTMLAELTYGLDGANNRTTSGAETSGGAVTSTYALQDSTHPQGASNRYDTITTGGNAVVMDHDGRGNLIYDGNFAYFYDYMNRLQEVYRVVPAEGMAMQEGEKFALVEEESAAEARKDIHDEIPDLMQRIVREHMNPVFRARLKKHLNGGVIRLLPSAQNGGGVSQFADAATLELVAVYIYDGFNRRTVTVPIGLIETQFHTFDGWRQVEQYGLGSVDGTNLFCLPNKQFVWGSRLDELVSYRRRNPSSGAWENYFVLHGGQDTAAKLVNDAGVVVEQYEYDPYGKVTVYDGSGSLVGDGSVSGVGLPFLWKGIRLDGETGLLYMRNRYYSTAMGRFLVSDPIGVWGDRGNWGNAYAYVCANPLTRGDPYGLQGPLTLPTPVAAPPAQSMPPPPGPWGGGVAPRAGARGVNPVQMVVGMGLDWLIRRVFPEYQPPPWPSLKPDDWPLPPNPPGMPLGNPHLDPDWPSPLPDPPPPPGLPPVPPVIPEPVDQPPMLDDPIPGLENPGPCPDMPRPGDPDSRTWCKQLCESVYEAAASGCDRLPGGWAREACHEKIQGEYTECIRNCNRIWPDMECR